MKKFAAIAVAASMFALAACGEKAADEATTTEAPAADATMEAGADAAAAGADAAAEGAEAAATAADAAATDAAPAADAAAPADAAAAPAEETK